MADIKEPISITDKVLKEGSGNVNKLVSVGWLLPRVPPPVYILISAAASIMVQVLYVF